MVFSPPSIVKDALSISQSAALLLEDEQNETIMPENLDNSTSSQVQFNLIQFNDDSNGTKHIHHPSSLNYHQKMILLHNQQKLYNENVATTACKTLRNQKHFVPLTQNRLAIRSDLYQDNETVTYNPYANENDHDTKFQLSKSIQYQNELNQNHRPIEIPLVRRFGQDRTNFYNILPKVETINKRLAVNGGVKNNSHTGLPAVNQQQQFNCFSLKDRISISSHYSKNETIQTTQHTLPSNENSQSNDSQSTLTFNSNSNENLTFKNYDLNDEFWLNFDQ